MNLRSIKRWVSALLILVLTAGFAPGALAAVQAKVNSGAARAYASASAGAKSVKLKKNLKVKITAVSGGWAKVKYKGKTAYIRTDDLSPAKKSKRYASKDASVYNSSGDAVAKLNKGDAVYLLGTLGGHYCVTNGSGGLGFMASGSLSSKKPAAQKQPASNPSKQKLTKAEKAIAVAESLLGAKYALNDNPPHSFNCSSFVKYCMSKAGISMKDTAAKQAADGRYKKISKVSDLKKGDVLFFAEGKSIDHSAIYLGGGKFIEASAAAGQVQTNSMTDWYKSHFKFARRP